MNMKISGPEYPSWQHPPDDGQAVSPKPFAVAVVSVLFAVGFGGLVWLSAVWLTVRVARLAWEG